jgi:hypothetical protein
MKIFSATVLTLGLLTAASRASFADVNQAPLAPGKPAGVHAAQYWEGDRGIFIVAGAAAIGIGIALATANNNSAASPTPNTGSSVSSTSTTAP